MNPLEKLFDPFGIADSYFRVCRSWLREPRAFSGLFREYLDGMEKLSREHGPASWNSGNPDGDEQERFLKLVKFHTDAAKKIHGVWSRWLTETVEKAPGMNERERRISRFWTRQLVLALSPGNCFWFNPAAVKRFMESGGESLVNGMKNWLEDISSKDPLVKTTDIKAFRPGENLAATPGHVVFRNPLMELIQYAPATEKTYAVPVVMIQPWINKYYIFDLDESNSFVRYLIGQGFTVFITSWKNPTPDMRDVSFENYLFHGVLEAIEAARDISAAPRVHATGYCIGGTALTALMAWFNAELGPDTPVADWTLFSTLVDFSSPGDLDVYVRQAAVERIEELMEAEGCLDAAYIGLAFRLLRPESLIWPYFVHCYLMGDVPPKSAVMYWNSDGTRLPARMCSDYLRGLYLDNLLANRGRLVLGGRPVDLARIRQPLYAVGAAQDHICPWRETFRVSGLVGGTVRYALASEGHIAGIVNPPAERSRKKYWVGDAGNGMDLEAWEACREQGTGSWWPDWVQWLSRRSGPMAAPPSPGSERLPVLDKAPGRYVLER